MDREMVENLIAGKMLEIWNIVKQADDPDISNCKHISLCEIKEPNGTLYMSIVGYPDDEDRERPIDKTKWIKL